MADRYWRVIGFKTDSGALTLSGLHLYGGGERLDAGAVLEASLAPYTGDVAALQAVDPVGPVSWLESAVRAGGFSLQWTFASAVSVDGVRLRSPDDTEFARMLTLQSSADGVAWATVAELGRFDWPGVDVLTPVPASGTFALLMHMDGDATDSSGNARTVTLVGPPSFLSNGARFEQAMQVTGSAHVVVTDMPAIGDVDFAISFWITLTSFGHILTFSGQRFNIAFWVSGRLTFYRQDTGYAQDFYVPSLTAAPVHFELSREDGLLTIRVGGVLCFSYSAAVALTAGPMYLGSYPGGTGAAGAYDELAVVIGSVLHSADFDPPSAPYFGSSVGSGPGAAALIAAATSLPVGAQALGNSKTRLMPGTARHRDVEFGGAGRIWGTTKTKATPSNLPTKARVVLLHQRSKQLVRETWSDPVTGAFAFDGIDTRQEFLTLAEDAAGAYRPVAANRLVPEVLT